MSDKIKLMRKLFSNPITKTFTMKELNRLMSQCGCRSFKGGRGSGIGFVHDKTNRVLQFDAPHPEKELYTYQVKLVRKYIIEIGEGGNV